MKKRNNIDINKIWKNNKDKKDKKGAEDDEKDKEEDIPCSIKLI